MKETIYKILLMKLCFLLGVVVGIYLSPVKKGIKVINYNQCDGRLIKETESDNEQN